jgi:stearoyl-CoA desaturase (delta-9 desaturase)
VIREIINWFDSYSIADDFDEQSDRIELLRIIPFITVHAGVLLVFWVGFSWIAVVVAVTLYVVRMFAITAFYHRYFAHRAFKTSRSVQFLFAYLGNSAAQRGPLWWAAHHRHHHRYTDQPEDTHSPKQHGFLWSHLLWFLTNKSFRTHSERIKDYCVYPELVWIDRFDSVAPVSLVVLLFGLGAGLNHFFPGLYTNGLQMVVWGFAISTVALYHATFTINSLSHMFGSQRYDTGDTSRNNALLALLTLGEGWHNNHHHYAGAARQGFFWWELDFTYYILKLFSLFGIVHHLKPLPEKRRLMNTD